MGAECLYLDHAATTPLDPRAREAMLPFLGLCVGNPSSLHLAGRRTRAAVDEARQEVAGLVGASADEIVFTASGTEASNLAVLGVMTKDGAAQGHLVTSAIEHPAVLETCRSLERRGVEVTYVGVEPNGIVSPQALSGALRPDTRLVSIMAANNVVGTLQPIAELCRIAKRHGALFHTDAVQAAGKIALSAREHGFDLMSLSAHKLYGPQGVGALFVREGVALAPIIYGGGQERALRSATENVAGIVGFGRAAAIARHEMVGEAARLVGLHERLFDGATTRLPNSYVIGDRYKRLPGHVCLGLAGQEGEAIKLLLALDERGIAVSSGSACSARHRGEPSHVLQAMQFDPVAARGALRVTLGRFTTEHDVDCFLDALCEVATTLRPLTSHPSL